MRMPSGRSGPIVFLHIPKAAGTTLSEILRHHYPGQTFAGGINVFQRLGDARPHLEAAAKSGKLRALSAEVTFGLASEYLPTARYITILREPVERTLSQIWYLRAGHGAGQVRPGTPQSTPDLTLDEAISGGYVLDNLQTRMLCGIVSPFDALPADALERAKHTLAERFAYVGTAERFDDFLALLNLGLGWPTVPYQRKRVNPLSTGRDGFSARELRRLEEGNALDRQLFEHADVLLTRALEAAGPALADELEVLRRALPLGSRARKGRALDAGAIRGLPLEARVALALKEAELSRARMVLQRKGKRLRRLKAMLAARTQPTLERDADRASR